MPQESISVVENKLDGIYASISRLERIYRNIVHIQKEMNKLSKVLHCPLFDLPCDLELPRGYETNVREAYIELQLHDDSVTFCYDILLKNRVEATAISLELFTPDNAAKLWEQLDRNESVTFYTCADLGMGETHGDIFAFILLADALTCRKCPNIKCLWDGEIQCIHVVYSTDLEKGGMTSDEVLKACYSDLQTLGVPIHIERAIMYSIENAGFGGILPLKPPSWADFCLLRNAAIGG